jgi:hypothetical protein
MLQRLFDTLPKALKYHTNEKASIDIVFENGTYVNDLGTWLVLRDFLLPNQHPVAHQQGGRDGQART